MIGSGDAESGDADSSALWLFRKQAHVQDAMVLLQPMQGKVLAPAVKAKAKAKSKSKADGKGTTATAKGKAKAKVRAGPDQNKNMIEEPEKTTDHVACAVDGVPMMRTKYFLDCLMNAIRTALLSARKRFGTPVGSNEVDPLATLGTTNHDHPNVYYDHEIPVLRRCLRLGIIFAMKGQLTMDKKIHKRWSTCRPQIQAFAISMIERVPFTIYV